MSDPTSTVVIDQQNTHRLRAGKVIMFAIALLLVGGVLSTFAFLTYQGNRTPNRFTVNEHLTCDMLEPAWTNAALTDNGITDLANPQITDATAAKYFSVDGVGVPKASLLQVPGTYYAKNPFVVNTSTSASASDRDRQDKTEDRGFAGLKVQFQKVNSEGAYVNMTGDEVKKLLACFYIGSKETTTATDGTVTTQTTGDTKAGFGNGTDDNGSYLGNDWYQLTGSNGSVNYGTTTKGEANSAGAMYFVNNKRLDSLVETRTTEETTTETGTQTVIKDFQEDPTSATWGYSVTGENVSGTDYCYATTPLFQTVRYVDGATKDQMDALRDVLDPKNDAGKRTISEVAELQPGWRMVISSGMIQAENATDSVVDSSKNVKTDSVWFTNFKTVLDATSGVNGERASKPVAATGVRNESTLGSYLTKTTEGATLNAGTGVPEPTNIG